MTASRPSTIVGSVILVALALVVLLAALQTDPHQGERDVCSQAYADRIGHDPSDAGFWEMLQGCARQGRLPAGANDPAAYR